MTALRKPDDTRLVVTCGSGVERLKWGQLRSYPWLTKRQVVEFYKVVLGVEESVTVDGTRVERERSAR